MRTIGFSNYAVRPIGTYSNSNIGYIGSMNNKPIKKINTLKLSKYI